MTQENKELLLKDIYARIPHGVKVAFFNEDLTYHSEPKTLIGIECINNLNYSRLEDEDGNTTIVEFVKPYLFPLSSMTEEQKQECFKGTPLEIDKYGGIAVKDDKYGNSYYTDLEIYLEVLDWLNKNHFDYRGLIEKGLALDATGMNIY